MAKPTFASVTNQPCECGYLQRAADAPDLPIVYDARLNEFNLVYPFVAGDGDEGTKFGLQHAPHRRKSTP